MSIQRLLLETIIILAIITGFVILLNGFQVYNNASKFFSKLERQYLDSTFQIYQNQIIGDLLIGDKKIINILIKEVSDDRNIGVELDYKKNKFSYGVAIQASSKSYNLDLGNGNVAKITFFSRQNFDNVNGLIVILPALLIELLVLGLGFLYLWWRFNKSLLYPLANLAKCSELSLIESQGVPKDALREIKNLFETLQQLSIDTKKKAKYEAEVMTAKQVAHDIRSPLACLNLLLSYVAALPEKQRILARSSIQRITDIANLLQNKAKRMVVSSKLESKQENIMLSSLLELLVTEKRMQLGLASNIHINLNLDKAYGLFSNINVTEFRSMLSNLINNSIEACSNAKSHHIIIVVEPAEKQMVVRIDDDGKGIPANVLDKIGSYGFSYGKEELKSSGSGLGVYHALKTVASFDGTLSIQSKVNVGTSVVIKLPQSAPPKWFVNEVKLDQIKLLVILDDDKSIHDLWEDKLEKEKKRYEFKIKHFLSVNKFEDFYHDLPSWKDVLFLFDYEFVGQDTNGLDVVEKFQLEGRAILVTSHYDDPDIRKRAIALNIGIIPKGIVSYVPIP